MGTTSGGATGSGSGMRANGGRGWSGGNGTVSFNSKGDKIKLFNNHDLEKELSAIMKALFSRTEIYYKESFSNSYTIEVYNELFKFSALLKKDFSPDKIYKRYGIINDGTNLLFQIIDSIHNKCPKEGIDSRCIDNTRITLERFIFASLGKSQGIAFSSNNNEILETMRNNIGFWSSLSGNFLTRLANLIFQKEVEKKIKKASNDIYSIIESRSNEIIDKIREKNQINGKYTYSKLLEDISNNWEILKKEMTK